ncbi:MULTISPECIES: hypothetical protein [Brevibacillus]|uniref:hypothetical protein n=1 Tax=Brevibacillus TaxID=55080 RepID=UPI001A7F04A2|nr:MULTISPECIES: hypothetical protein [Brevibacillus]MBG9787676.1 hypothetical protein [Brevibacillus laterosporus]MBG9803619.1 hypothetical protein [Brevibacillus laterosporus]MCG7315684.1 hypothetical protein [Brevibacillus laterosporus]MED1789605.1 hypothetical protein [Brevibacillus laterosporus]MED2003572.1 hypothetical protein [Brevibacillus laterosporus]
MTVLADFMIWLFAAYGCSALLLKMFYIWMESGRATAIMEPLTLTHYQLLLHNSEHRVEEAVRTLMFQSGLYGQPISISFVDEGSSDDTPRMTEILYRVHPDTIREQQAGREPVVVIDLRTDGKEAS